MNILLNWFEYLVRTDVEYTHGNDFFSSLDMILWKINCGKQNKYASFGKPENSLWTRNLQPNEFSAQGNTVNMQ